MTDQLAVAAEELAMQFFQFGAPDPYPLYRRLNELGEVHRSPLAWLVTSHAGCEEALRDPRLSSRLPGGMARLDPRLEEGAEPSLVVRLIRDLVNNIDPPDHTRQRKLLSKAFTPRRIEQLRVAIEGAARRIVDDAVERAAAHRRLAFVDEIANPLPSTTLCTMLGMPTADRVLLRRWADDITVYAQNMIFDVELHNRADIAAHAFVDYAEALIAERRARPADDLLTELIEAEEQGDRLSREELLSIMLAFVMAGNDTTTGALANAVVALDSEPGLRTELAHDPSVTRTAIEELLRFEGPVQSAPRTAGKNLELRGVPIAAGDILLVVLGAGNRDPRHFPDPERLDFRRENLPGLSFGHGIHYCLGAALARLQMQSVLPHLYRRLPDARIDGDVTWRQLILLRSPQELYLTW